jgi:curved DNA-binding protein CbpA
MAEKSHYDILDIPPTADLDAIKRAYRRQMRQHHPDQYIARRDELRRNGDASALRDIERTMQHAQTMTKRINEAYRVLADKEQRERYDRDQFLKRQRERNNARQNTQARGQTRGQARTYRDPRTTSRTTSRQRVYEQTQKQTERNAPRTPQASNEPMPYVWLAGLVIVLLVGFSFVNSFFGGILQAERTYPTAIGFTADELQATTSSRQATRVARTQAANAPTRTPVGQNDLVASANAFYRAGSFIYAVEGYSEAIVREPANAELYYLRGRAHLGMAVTPQDDPAQSAIADFDRAILLDADLVDAYLERGLVYYTRWLVTGDDDDAQQARSDLQRYAVDVPPDDVVREALDNLP